MPRFSTGASLQDSGINHQESAKVDEAWQIVSADIGGLKNLKNK